MAASVRDTGGGGGDETMKKMNKGKGKTALEVSGKGVVSAGAGRGMMGKKNANPLRRHGMGMKGGVRRLGGAGLPTANDLRRLARRGGVKRIGAGTHEEAFAALRCFLEKIIRDAALYVEHARRKTVTPLDIVLAAKRNEISLYGYGDMTPRAYIGRKADRIRRAAYAGPTRRERNAGLIPAAATHATVTVATMARESFDAIKIVISGLFKDRNTDRVSRADILETMRLLNPGRPAAVAAAELERTLDHLAEDNRVLVHDADVYLI